MNEVGENAGTDIPQFSALALIPGLGQPVQKKKEKKSTAFIGSSNFQGGRKPELMWFLGRNTWKLPCLALTMEARREKLSVAHGPSWKRRKKVGYGWKTLRPDLGILNLTEWKSSPLSKPVGCD